jgi:hypothetical protein
MRARLDIHAAALYPPSRESVTAYVGMIPNRWDCDPNSWIFKAAVDD